MVLAEQEEWAAKRMCNGALVGFSKQGTAYTQVLKPWVQCALDPECITPRGSSRMNHRQDQAGLSVLVDRAFGLGPNTKGGACSTGAVAQLGVALHKDESLSREECNKLVGREVPPHKHIWY